MKRIRIGAALAVAAFSVALPAAAQQGQRISITTGGTGGVYYPLGRRHGQHPVEARPRPVRPPRKSPAARSTT